MKNRGGVEGKKKELRRAPGRRERRRRAVEEDARRCAHACVPDDDVDATRRKGRRFAEARHQASAPFGYSSVAAHPAWLGPATASTPRSFALSSSTRTVGHHRSPLPLLPPA